MTLHQTSETVDILAADRLAGSRESQERIASAAVGLVLTGAAVLSERSATRVLLGVAGTLLLARGISGLRVKELVTVAKNLFQKRSDLERRFHDGEHDIVDAASFDSFPASDPPSYSPGVG